MIIGRQKERKQLEGLLASDRSEFAAVYGRRRIGKTFLIRESFQYNFTFQHEGLFKGDRTDQLYAFSASLKDAGLTDASVPENWLEAFELLKDLIRKSPEQKKVIFIDELSWMDTPKSKLIMALESFWNGWASGRKDIVLIICSSVTSWMINKVIHNKGGLYQRLTERIYLQPFTLHECEEYVEAESLAMNRAQILEGYMIMGGVPYYWSHLQKGLSLSQNIDRMFFAAGAPLDEEFEHLFSSLFRYPEEYILIIKALAGKKSGLTRNEILRQTGIEGSGNFSAKLDELNKCGFIRPYTEFGKKKKDMVYQLIDPYTIFYFHFLEDKPKDENYWTNQLNTPVRNVWNGLAFERICMWHTANIKRALGISGVLTDICSWSCKADPDNGLHGSQIDMIIVRKDQVINLLEMRYSATPYAITKESNEDLMRKRNDFITATGTRSAVHLTMATPLGIIHNSYAGNIQSEIVADDLFY
ncbi:MAG: ATP-binding protein [Eubacteriaceae bacterium]|nr:ATP-binding protein [Eubacteriaceae bacterium]